MLSRSGQSFFFFFLLSSGQATGEEGMGEEGGVSVMVMVMVWDLISPQQQDSGLHSLWTSLNTATQERERERVAKTERENWNEVKHSRGGQDGKEGGKLYL